MARNLSSKIPASVACLGVAAIGGLYVLAMHEHSQKIDNTPYTIVSGDINHDGLEDIVVSNPSGTQEFFLKQKDGSYHRRVPDYKLRYSSDPSSSSRYNPGFN